MGILQTRYLKMADIILVQSIVGEWDDIKSAPSPPLSLLSVASIAVQKYDVKIIDQRMESDWKQTLKKELDKNPLMVGTNAVTGPQIAHALEISRFVKENSKVPVVWGGKHATILPYQTLQNPYIDFVIAGEGEEAIVELAEALKKKKSYTQIKGLCYKKDSEIIVNPRRPFLDMDKLPDIPYYLIDIKKYLPKYLGVPSVYVETSRGCPQQCQFCYNIEFNKCRWRAMSAEKALDRIKKALEISGAKGIFFVDDEFFVDLERGRKICQGIIDAGYNIKYGIQGVCLKSILRMDDDYLKLVESSGCRKIMLGVESGSDRVLELVKKDITVAEVLESNKKLAKTAIIPSYYMMAGFPTETKEELKMSINLIFQLLKENPNALISPMHCFTPYPGCTMYDLAIQQGFQPPQKLEEWVNYSTTSMNALRTGNEKKFYEALTFLSLFIDNKCKEVVDSKLIRFISKAYQPFARFRFRHLLTKGMLTKKVKDMVFPEY